MYDFDFDNLTDEMVYEAFKVVLLAKGKTKTQQNSVNIVEKA